MARKTEVVTIDAEGRDFGKQYLLTEMPAAQAEAWANRALLALSRSGAEVPAGIPAGMAGIYVIGVKALSGINWSDAKPLLDEMFACIRIVPGREHPEISRPLLDDDIEEVQTRWHLRERIVSLHLGFSLAAKMSTYLQVLSAATPSTSPTTSTSPSPSDGSSQPN